MGRVGALTLLERREEQSPLQPALRGVDTARRWPRPWLPGASSWGATTGTASERQCPAGEAGAEDQEDRGKGGGPGGSGRRGHRQDPGRHGVAAGKRRACTASWREASERGLGPESLAVSVTLAFRGWNWDPEGRSLERVLGTNCQRTLCVTVRRENRREMRLVSAQRQTAGADVVGSGEDTAAGGGAHRGLGTSLAEQPSCPRGGMGRTGGGGKGQASSAQEDSRLWPTRLCTPCPGGYEGSDPNVPTARKTPGLRSVSDHASQPKPGALSNNPSDR